MAKLEKEFSELRSGMSDLKLNIELKNDAFLVAAPHRLRLDLRFVDWYTNSLSDASLQLLIYVAGDRWAGENVIKRKLVMDNFRPYFDENERV